RIRGIDPEAMTVLCRYRWPGNVRELKNVIERAVVVATSDVIKLEDLPERLNDEEVTDRSQIPPGRARERQKDRFRERVQAVERALIRRALAGHRGRSGDAASSLGIAQRTLNQKITLHRIASERSEKLSAEEKEI